MIGVAAGFPLMILPVGLGVMKVFELWPLTYTLLMGLSVLYLLWLAWKIANAGAPKEARAGAEPLTFLQAAAFQWVNPKAWSMALGAITLYAASREFGAVALISLMFLTIGTLSALTWTTLGTAVRRLLANPRRLRLFNLAMALLLLASMAPVLWAQFSSDAANGTQISVNRSSGAVSDGSLR